MFEDNIIADTGHGSHLRPTEACAALGNGPARGFGFECKEMLRMVKVFDSPVPRCRHMDARVRWSPVASRGPGRLKQQCRVTLNSGTRRIGQRLLPLNMTFRRQIAEVFPFP